MSRTAKKTLFDKDIRELEIKAIQYRVVVGNPSELVLFVYPSGVKSFALRIRKDKTEKNITLQKFRQGIYSVAEARKEAKEKLKLLLTGAGLDKNKYIFKNLYKAFITQKRKKGHAASSIKATESICNNHLLPHFRNLDAKEIKHSNILIAFNTIFNDKDPKNSRLETIKRARNILRGILAPALKDHYIDYDPTLYISKEFPNIKRFHIENNIDSRLPALTNDNEIKAFLDDLKSNALDIRTSRAIYLQILCVNRPINTVSAKWDYIDLDNKIWSIPAKEMKMKSPHIIALNSYAMEILKAQKKDFNQFNSRLNDFVFITFNKSGHIHRDTLSKALRSLNHGKWRNRVTTHGFRATFRTICSIHKAELLKLGISDEVIETALAHKTLDSVKYAYEREKANIEQLMILMQWYGDFLNDLSPFNF